MNFFKQLIVGYKNYWKGLQFLVKHKLYWFIIFPMLLFWGVYELGVYFERLEGSISADLTYRIGEVESITGLTWMTLKMIFYDKLYIIFTKFTLYIVIVLLSPVLAIISEKTEAILTGNKYPINLWQLWKDIKRAIRLNSRLILIEYQ